MCRSFRSTMRSLLMHRKRPPSVSERSRGKTIDICIWITEYHSDGIFYAATFLDEKDSGEIQYKTILVDMLSYS